jgi:hypothetical protein
MRCGNRGRMAVMGQSRRFDRAPMTSGLSSRSADILRVSRYVSKVPQAAMPNHVMEQTFRPAGTMSFGDEQPLAAALPAVEQH